ncbi:AMP-binding protein [Aquihabitans sp. G128]|uniref:class I adenylate-forming enzyme family protein n=1 Tax=Aquihabitans sp. G128 TaxID=2849779 RepID=UPI001C230050|nr:AMP-binding protein [Aquihabitans sp. G128]QXC59397.1 AMP-binding protein [Aquihabitans sp. G128]
MATEQPASTPVDHLQEAWAELTGEGGPFAMVEAEVLGLPMRVFASAPPSMRSIWELAQGYADRTYLVYEDEHLTYAEVGAQVRALAHHLRDVHGVGRGDRVALAMRNYPEWVVGYWAIVSIGAAVVGMNAWWTTPEMAHGLSDSQPKVLIADAERLERALPILSELRAAGPLPVIAVRFEDDLPDDAVHWADVVTNAAADAPAELPPADIDPDDDATIFYTSGTTGFPKGAQLTHRGSVHNILHLVFWTSVSGLAAAKDGVEPSAKPAPEQLVFMGSTPLFHVTACNCLLHPATLAGGRVVLLRKWDAGRALELIEREGVTNFSGVPTMSRELLAHPDWATRDTSTLTGMAGGGAPVPPDLVGKIDDALPEGAPSTGYGLTETSGIITANASRYYLAKPSSCGPVVPTLDAKLIDEAGDDLAPGPDVLGQLCVRGPIVIKGYLNRPEATAEAIRDGWFETGDIARIDEDGFVTIVDRAKDMVLRGGENVYCSEVEAAIYDHPDVAEAAVFGIPDDRLGESVAAVVVLAPGASLDQDALRAFLADRIATYKVPTSLWFRSDPLPRNATGKFLKKDLRAAVLADEPADA